MDKNIPNACHFSPGHFWVVLLDLFGNYTRCLANRCELISYGAYRLGAVEKSLKVHACCEVKDIAGTGEDILHSFLLGSR